MLANPNPKKPRKMRARFNLDLAKDSKGNWYIKLSSSNGRTFNHKYNSFRKAKQSADSLARSMKLGHCKKLYE